MKAQLVSVIAAAALTLAGCAASPKADEVFKTDFGQSAVTIANQIHGCEDVALFDVGDGTKSGVTSAARCILDGREVTLFTFKDAASSNVRSLIEAGEIEQYWAEGKGWAAFETDDSLIALQLRNDTKALSEYMFDKSMPTPDIAGEKVAATRIAKGLDGRVEHFKP